MLEIPDIVLDFSKYASLDALGDGEAKQKLRQLDDALETAQKDLGQAQRRSKARAGSSTRVLCPRPK